MTFRGVILFVATIAGGANSENPAAKVVALLSDLAAKIQEEGKEADKTFAEFEAWCKERHDNLAFEIKSAKAELEDLSATIEKEVAKADSFHTEVEELAASIAKDEADLKEAKEIRASEHDDFSADERERNEVIGALERAIAVLTREKAKHGAAMLQKKGKHHLKEAHNIAEALGAMVHASDLSAADASTLTSLVQNSQAGTSEEDDALGAPDPVAYKVDRDDIIGTLDNLLEKARDQLEKARKTEQQNRHNFELLEQGLEDSMAADQHNLAAAKKNIAACEEAKATAEGEIAVTKSDLKEDQHASEMLERDCKDGRREHKAETKSRAEETHALAAAKKVLVSNGVYTEAVVHTYGPGGDDSLDQAPDFFQVSRSDLMAGSAVKMTGPKMEMVNLISHLAKKEHSAALAQLASKVSSIIRFGGTDGDPMGKVKQLISDMIETLERDAKAEASHEAFCKKEIAESNAKNKKLQAELDKLSTNIDTMTAKTAKLKEETVTISVELGKMTRAQAESNKIRQEQKAEYAKK
jgi:hypothetical protein